MHGFEGTAVYIVSRVWSNWFREYEVHSFQGTGVQGTGT